MNDELKITDQWFVQKMITGYIFNLHKQPEKYSSNYAMCMEACAHTYVLHHRLYIRVYILYRLYTAYKSVQDTYVNGQVGISIKLSDMYCCI